MRIASLAFFWVAAALASAEPDGAVAEPARWTGPNGPPSNSRRSRALPVTRDVVAAWTVTLPGEAVAPPVTWDGVAYLLCAAGDNRQLVAVDMTTGTLLARKQLPGAPDAPIHVWGGVVYVFSRQNQVSGFRQVGNTFVEKWKFGLPGSGGYTMTVFENEMYIAGEGSLMRAAPGLREPTWSVPGGCGPPAIYGESVLDVGMDARGIPSLVSHDRRSGAELGSARLGMANGGKRGATVDITAGAGDLLVRTPWAMEMEQGTATDAFVSFSFEGDLLKSLSAQGFMNFRVKAAVYKGGLIACESEREWHWWRGAKGQVIAQRDKSPDLFEQMVAPTVVGNVIYFGTWAADVETGEILWRLPLRTLRFGVVPADRLFLALDGEQKMHAYKPRVGR